MKKKYLTFELSKELKILGFTEKCIACFMVSDDENDNQEPIFAEFNDYEFPLNNESELWNDFNNRNDFIYSAPLIHDAIDWLEEKLKACIMFFYNENQGTYGFKIYPLDERENWVIEDRCDSKRYELGTFKDKLECKLKAIELSIIKLKEIQK